MFGRRNSFDGVLYRKYVEENLPENMKNIKKRALSGDSEAQYQIGIYYMDQADSNIMSVGIHFLAHAAYQSHEKALSVFRSYRKDWRDYYCV